MIWTCCQEIIIKSGFSRNDSCRSGLFLRKRKPAGRQKQDSTLFSIFLESMNKITVVFLSFSLVTGFAREGKNSYLNLLFAKEFIKKICFAWNIQ